MSIDIKEIETSFAKGLEELFSNAQKKDEFEFIMVLLGYDGAIGDPRALSHLYESERLFKEFSKMISSNAKTFISIRIGLFLYCHFFEMNELYRVIGNLLHILNGRHYQIGLFSNFNNEEDKDLYPTNKISVLKELAVKCNQQDFIKLFDFLYFNRLRNSFLHSDYSIVGNDYLFFSNKPIIIDNTKYYSLMINDFVLPLVQSVVRIAIVFFELINKFKSQYTTNKLIQGRFPDLQPIVILGNIDKGLIGFETIYGSSIKLTEIAGQPFLAAFNIRVTRSKKPSAIELRIIKIVDKNQYQKNDPELNVLETEIVATKDIDLLKRLAIPYYNWGNNICSDARSDSNTKKQAFMYNLSIEKYDKALMYDADLAVCIFNRALTFLRLKKIDVEVNYNDKEIADQFERVIALKPEMPEVYEPTSDLLYNLGKNCSDWETSIIYYKKAISFFGKVLEFNTEKSYVHYNTGITFIELIQLETKHAADHTAKGRKSFESAITLEVNNVDYYLGYASLLEKAADFINELRIEYLKEANSLIDSAIEINASLSRPYYKKGINFFLLSFEIPGEKDKLLLSSIAAYQKAIELNNLNDTYFNNLGLALYYLGLQNYNEKTEPIIREAIDNLENALNIKADKKESYLNLGLCYFLLYKLCNIQSDADLTIKHLQSAAALGQNIDYELLAFYSFKENEVESLKHLNIYKENINFSIEKIQQDRDMAFLLRLEDAKKIIK